MAELRKVLHTETLRRWGGQQNRTLTECIELNKRRYYIALAAAHNSEILRRAKKQGIRIFPLTMTKKNCLASIIKLYRIIKKEDIGILVSHGSTDSWVAGIVSKLSRGRVKFIRVRHNLFPVKSALSRFFLAGIPHRVVAISYSVKEYMAEIGVPENKLTVIYTCVDINRFRPTEGYLVRRELNVPEKAFVIGGLSSRKKEPDDFIHTAVEIGKKHQSAYFVLVGKVSEGRIAKLSFVCQKAGILNRVIFVGFRNDMPRIFSSFDCFLFPSISEGLGTVILESMACGVPVIAYNLKPMLEIISHGEDGLLAECSIADLVKNTTLLLENPSLGRKMGEKARKKVINLFPTEKMIKIF